MVKAGAPTDAVIEELVPLLEPGDVVVDGGNAHFADTRRREAALRERGLHFVGTGVSGGEEGALYGPSIMPGGSPEAYASLGPILESIAATVDGTPCCAYIGPDGSGHFVKMVHNGIEYADMQLIAEAYDVLRYAGGLAPAELAGVFREWNSGDLESFLIEITAQVLEHVDAKTGQPFVDVIRDQAEQKGTGRWTVQIALDLGIPVTGIAEAVFARSLSANADPARGHRRPARAVRRARRPRVACRRCPARPVRVQSGRLRPGLRPDRGGQRGVRLAGRPGHARHHLARRVHHPGPLPQPHPRGVRERPEPALAAAGPVLHGTGRATPRTPGAAWSPPPPRSASRCPGSPRRWPTTTRCAATGCRPR